MFLEWVLGKGDLSNLKMWSFTDKGTALDSFKYSFTVLLTRFDRGSLCAGP